MASTMVMSNGKRAVRRKSLDSLEPMDVSDNGTSESNANPDDTNGESDRDEIEKPSENGDDNLLTKHDDNDESDIASKTQRRVKVYLLKEDNWLDHGTGICTGEIDSKTNKPYFLVRNELNQDEVILKAFLEGTTQYQRQQDTLIVWTDPSGKDIALSFQETQGCADLCNFIIRVQQEDLSPEISLYYVISTGQGTDESGNSTDITELITGPMTYPEMPTMTNLEESLDILNLASTAGYSKRCIQKFVIENDYLLKLIEVFEQSEKEHNLINLYSLSEIAKTLILYSQNMLLKHLLSTEERILGLIGMLEYDAEYPNQKSCHRQFLKEKANFKVVIQLPIEKDESGLDHFRKDFYYNFLKDVILARFIDDQTFTLLNAFIHINQVALFDFLKDLKKNNRFLEKLFSFYKNKTDISLQRNGIKLLHQYVILTKNLASNQRTTFFSELIQHGLIDMIKFSLNDDDLATKALGTELIVSIIEQDVSLVNSINDKDSIDISEPPLDYDDNVKHHETLGVKEFGLKLSDDMTLMTLLSQLLLEEKNFGLKTQAFEALKVLLDQNIGKIDENGAIPDYGAPTNIGNDISTEDYFRAFYAEVAPVLYKNLIDLGNSNTTSSELEEKIKSDQLLYQQLCELFSYCILTHEQRLQRPFFINNNILLGMSKILQTSCKMPLKLSVINCLSNVLASNDKIYTYYILQNHIIDIFFGFFKQVSKQNNLANSTCLSLLEVINDVPIGRNKAGLKALVSHIHDNYKTFCLEDLSYAQTGYNLMKLHEQLDTSNMSFSNANGDLHTDGDVVEEDEDYEDDVMLEDEMSEPRNLFEQVQKEYESAKEKRQNPFAAEEYDQVQHKKSSPSSNASNE